MVRHEASIFAVGELQIPETSGDEAQFGTPSTTDRCFLQRTSERLVFEDCDRLETANRSHSLSQRLRAEYIAKSALLKALIACVSASFGRSDWALIDARRLRNVASTSVLYTSFAANASTNHAQAASRVPESFSSISPKPRSSSSASPAFLARYSDKKVETSDTPPTLSPSVSAINL